MKMKRTFLFSFKSFACVYLSAHFFLHHTVLPDASQASFWKNTHSLSVTPFHQKAKLAVGQHRQHRPNPNYWWANRYEVDPGEMTKGYLVWTALTEHPLFLSILLWAFSTAGFPALCMGGFPYETYIFLALFAAFIVLFSVSQTQKFIRDHISTNRYNEFGIRELSRQANIWMALSLLVAPVLLFFKFISIDLPKQSTTDILHVYFENSLIAFLTGMLAYAMCHLINNLRSSQVPGSLREKDNPTPTLTLKEMRWLNFYIDLIATAAKKEEGEWEQALYAVWITMTMNVSKDNLDYFLTTMLELHLSNETDVVARQLRISSERIGEVIKYLIRLWSVQKLDKLMPNSIKRIQPMKTGQLTWRAV